MKSRVVNRREGLSLGAPLRRGVWLTESRALRLNIDAKWGDLSTETVSKVPTALSQRPSTVIPAPQFPFSPPSGDPHWPQPTPIAQSPT